MKSEFLLFWNNGAFSASTEDAIANARRQIKDTGDATSASLQYTFVNFSQTGFDDFNFTSRVNFKFELGYYAVDLGDDAYVYERLYSEQLSEKELDEMVKTLMKRHIQFVETKLNEKLATNKSLTELHEWLES